MAGFRGAGDAIEKTLRAGRAGVPRDLDKIGLKVVGKIRLELSKPGRGAIYTTRFFTSSDGTVHPYGSRPAHQASAPGDPPAVDTGALRASYSHRSERTIEGGDLIIGTGVGYAAYLEFGTSKMQPRPHLRPVMAKSGDTIRGGIEEGIEGRERAMARRLGGRG